MAKRANEERRRFWQGLLRQQPSSGLNIARFCEQAGVSQNSFFAWKRRLQSPDEGGKRRTLAGPVSSTHRKRLRRKPASKSLSLVPVRLIADVDRPSMTTGLIEIAWPDGVVLRVPAICNSDTLRDVFGLLMSARNGAASSC
jgi:hypothetical protein